MLSFLFIRCFFRMRQKVSTQYFCKLSSSGKGRDGGPLRLGQFVSSLGLYLGSLRQIKLACCESYILVRNLSTIEVILNIRY